MILKIIAFIEKNHEELREKYHITKIGVFGFFSRGDAGKNNDIDLIIEFDGPVENIHE